ncbi:hypothetical protein F383_27883 [Gossypium arboreum]|uniref:Uncharacterized protein n=1 Tax=Gossypium arboreum TaxID=29729 RepID=A0A0B0P838_GOSAR|nr:hypothetical protein F383_27883 [Gossypium arboreum]
MAYSPGTGAALAYGGLAWLLEALYGAYGAGGGLLRRECRKETLGFLF